MYINICLENQSYVLCGVWDLRFYRQHHLLLHSLTLGRQSSTLLISRNLSCIYIFLQKLGWQGNFLGMADPALLADVTVHKIRLTHANVTAELFFSSGKSFHLWHELFIHHYFRNYTVVLPGQQTPQQSDDTQGLKN